MKTKNRKNETAPNAEGTQQKVTTTTSWEFMGAALGSLIYRLRDTDNGREWMLWAASKTKLSIQHEGVGGPVTMIKPGELDLRLRDDIALRLKHSAALSAVEAAVMDNVLVQTSDEIVNAMLTLNDLRRQFDRESLSSLVECVEQADIIDDPGMLENLMELKEAAQASAVRRK